MPAASERPHDRHEVGYVDLFKITDPDGQAEKPLTGKALTFPFFTIENVDVVDATHTIAGSDDNLPFSSSREPDKADDNEFVLPSVPELLSARPSRGMEANF